MKKSKRKILLSCTLFTIGALCLGTACTSCNGTFPIEKEQAEIVIDKTSETLLIGEEVFLEVDYEPIAGYVLEFASENPEIASVSSDGKILGISEGTTTVTVTYGRKSQTCEITVGLGGQTPRFFFTQGFSDEVSVLLGMELDTSAYVLFNGVRYDDVTLTYEVDPKYGSITGNTFTSIKSGETEIGVTASWRGVESADFTRTVKVKIQKDLEVYVNDGSLSSFTLYTSDVTGESVRIPFAPVVSVDGVQQSDVTVTVANESVATYADGVLSAVSMGETTIEISHTELDVPKIFSIKVLRPVVEYEGEPIDFSAQDGDLDYSSKLGGETPISAEQNGAALTITDDGRIMGVVPNIIDDGSDRRVDTTKIVLYTPTVGYEYELTAYTKIIKKASDLSVLDISTSNEYATYAYKDDGTTVSSCKVDGYFVLGNDIAYDETWEGNANSAVTGSNAKTCHFAGTLDGKGYTLATNVGKGGLFGNLAGKALVKNVYIRIEKMSSNVGFGINGTGNSASHSTRFDNVYVSVDLDKSEHATPFALFQNCQGYLTLRNTIINVRYSQELVADRTYGVLWQATTNHTTHVFENSYIVTSEDEKPMISYYATKTSNGEKYVSSHYEVYAENEGLAEGKVDVSAEEDKNGLAHTKTIKILSGLRRYTSFGELQADKANCKFNDFEKSYWDTSTGIPLWKTSISAEELVVTAGNSPAGNVVNIPVINDSIEFAVKYDGVNLNALTETTVKLYGANAVGIVEIDGASVTGLDQGSVTVRVTYKLNGVTYTEDVIVTVGSSTTTNTDVVEYFSASDGVFDLDLLANGEVANDVLKATQLIDGEEVELTVSVGTNGELIIAGVTPNIVEGESTTYTSTVNKYTGTTAPTAVTSYSKAISDKTVGTVRLTIYTKQTTYIFTNVTAYTKVIDEASDWDVFKTATDGYYILKNDIDFNGATFAWENKISFTGVIDGNGRTVKNFSTSGLVYTLSGAIVKDISFVGAVTKNGLFGQDVNNWTIFDNVYTSLTLDGGFVFANNIKQSILTDVIVEIKNGDDTATERTKGLFASAVASGKCNQMLYNNVKVITIDNEQSGITIDDDVLVTYSTTNYCYASNDVGLLTESENVNWVYTGITRYADKADAQTVGNWTIDSDGKITWTEA